ncbi:hypothetical protein QE152_g10117 [Popillia japonica]|uniref:Uncharacterized protein n=1 Tax=Popillia japonica TaxID=7064 RepID=A0AAW1LVQ1_POPJA
MRNIARGPYLSSSRPLFKEYRILPVPCLYILYLLVLIRKDIDKINTNNFNHNYSTRHGTDLMTPSHRLTLSENPMYAGIALYNKLPKNFKEEMSMELFKRKVKEYLADNCFYTVDEYLEAP